VPFNRVEFLKTLGRHAKAGGKIFNGAYIVSTNGKTVDDMKEYITQGNIHIPKVVYLTHEVLVPMWKGRERLRPKDGDTLNSWHMMLGQMQGFGSFMAAQVIADLKYHEPLRHADDWHTFAASGPGSRRGLNYVLGRERGDDWTEDNWRLELGRLREKLLPMFKAEQMPAPHAQDIQNCLCEYNKWHACVFEGRKPKQLYRWN
jgi:hypothetical protein